MASTKTGQMLQHNLEHNETDLVPDTQGGDPNIHLKKRQEEVRPRMESSRNAKDNHISSFNAGVSLDEDDFDEKTTLLKDTWRGSKKPTEVKKEVFGL